MESRAIGLMRDRSKNHDPPGVFFCQAPIAVRRIPLARCVRSLLRRRKLGVNSLAAVRSVHGLATPSQCEWPLAIAYLRLALLAFGEMCWHLSHTHSNRLQVKRPWFAMQRQAPQGRRTWTAERTRHPSPVRSASSQLLRSQRTRAGRTTICLSCSPRMLPQRYGG